MDFQTQTYIKEKTLQEHFYIAFDTLLQALKCLQYPLIQHLGLKRSQRVSPVVTKAATVFAHPPECELGM